MLLGVPAREGLLEPYADAMYNPRHNACAAVNVEIAEEEASQPAHGTSIPAIHVLHPG